MSRTRISDFQKYGAPKFVRNLLAEQCEYTSMWSWVTCCLTLCLTGESDYSVHNISLAYMKIYRPMRVLKFSFTTPATGWSWNCLDQRSTTEPIRIANIPCHLPSFPGEIQLSVFPAEKRRMSIDSVDQGRWYCWWLIKTVRRGRGGVYSTAGRWGCLAHVTYTRRRKLWYLPTVRRVRPHGTLCEKVGMTHGVIDEKDQLHLGSKSWQGNVPRS